MGLCEARPPQQNEARGQGLESGGHGDEQAPLGLCASEGRGGGGWHKASVSDCLPLAAPIGLSPPLILTLCGPERVLVVSTEPPDDLSCLTTPGVGRPGDGAVARAVDQGHSQSMRGFVERGGGGGEVLLQQQQCDLILPVRPNATVLGFTDFADKINPRPFRFKPTAGFGRPGTSAQGYATRAFTEKRDTQQVNRRQVFVAACHGGAMSRAGKR